MEVKLSGNPTYPIEINLNLLHITTANLQSIAVSKDYSTIIHFKVLCKHLINMLFDWLVQ